MEIETVFQDISPFFQAGSLGSVPLWQVMPVLQTRLILEAPADQSLLWKVEGIPGVRPAKTIQGGRVTLTLDLGPIDPPKDGEANEDPNAHPRPSFSYSTCPSWSSVAKGYNALLNQEPNPDLGAWVKAAVGSATEHKVLIDRILAKMHREVRYTGIEFGSAAIVPRPPAETLRRGFGDCKDKATLLVALLGTAGIPARIVLLNSGYGKEADPDLPGLNAFDHAIVFVPSESLWIDPTAEFARAGELPWPDQGRPALIIDPEAVSLVRTPQLEAAGNLVLETREVFFGDQGPGRVLEISEFRGAAEMGLRANLAGDNPKALRERMDKYVQGAYKAKALGEMKIGELRDLSSHLRLTLDAKEAGVVQTRWKDATVELQIWPMLDKLRELLAGKVEEGKPTVPRTQDLIFFEPYALEWRYLVAPPRGFGIHELPVSDVLAFGPASLLRRFEKRPDGGVNATFRFESGKRRWTPADVELARKAIKEYGATNRQDLKFDHLGEALLTGGRVKEALDVFRGLAAAEPTKAVPLAHLAQALVSVGLGESAREKARQAVALEPDSATAQETLGWVLQFDLVGRRFGKGWDRAGAEAAYRKAKVLAPREWGFRSDFAFMLEHAPDGEKYGPEAKLDEAIQEYRYLKDELKVDHRNEFLLAALGYKGRFQEALDLARVLPASRFRNLWLVVAQTKVLGVQKALEELPKLLPSDPDRKDALGLAAETLVNFRCYSDASTLLKAKAQTADGAADILARAEILAKTIRFEEFKFDASDPRSVFQKILTSIEGEGKDLPDMAKLLTPPMRDWYLARPKEWASLKVWAASGSQVHLNSGTERKAALDIALSQCQFQIDGVGDRDFRIRAKFPSASGSGTYRQDWIFTLEDGKCRLAAVGKHLNTYGREALLRVERGDLAGARIYLDWARDISPRSMGEDPLWGRAFPYLWNRGQEGGVDELSLASASLLIWDKEDDRVVPILLRMLPRAQDPTKTRFIRQALATAYEFREHWDAMEAASKPLREEFPESKAANTFHLYYLDQTKRWVEYLAFCEQLLKRFPDEESYRSSKSEVLSLLEKNAEKVQWLESLVERQMATASHFNSLAWSLLMQGKATEESLGYARKAVQLATGDRWPSQHTLASILAELGRTTEAMDVLKQRLASRPKEEPNGDEWYVVGRIAEQLGEFRVAQSSYDKVPPPDPKSLDPEATFALASRRKALMGALAK